MARAAFVVHGHFYQPPRENPWTEQVPVEASAAPFHDWNERVLAECYRPNAFARIVDDHGFVVAVVNNYSLLSFNAGPTLLGWMEAAHPEVYERMLAADAATQSAIAQGYNHLILPLATDRDIRTQVRWGLADFAHRFGRPAAGLWLPECAVDDRTLAVLAEEGVRFTILAPGQAARVRALDGGAWREVHGDLDTRRPYRWRHPDGGPLGVDIVFYDGPLSHDLAFGWSGRSSEALVARALAAADGDALVCAATDGETFGHHHKFTERMIAYALGVEAPRRGLQIGGLAHWLADHRPTHEVGVRTSAWSCAHGVERWRSDCGCATGGGPGWGQQWRTPLRQALDLLRDHAGAVFATRGGRLFADPWAVRDAYVEVLLGADPDAFAARHLVGAPTPERVVEALTLLEAQRQAMLMYTSCGWFFSDLAGIEGVQVLRYAARLVDLLDELGAPAPMEAFLAELGRARSNVPEEGTGRDVWERHVLVSRVVPERVVAHVALSELLNGGTAERVGGYEVVRLAHRAADRGALAMVAGRLAVTHLRTRRRSEFAYGALHVGGLEVVGSSRRAFAPAEDDADLGAFVDAFEAGERITGLIRRLLERFGGHEFGLDSALPGAPGAIAARAAQALADRFAATFEQLVDDNRGQLDALARAGYPLPAELRLPAELSLARQLESDLVAVTVAARTATLALDDAEQAIDAARTAGLSVRAPRVVAALVDAVEATVGRAMADPGPGAVATALAVLRLARRLDAAVDLSHAQERLYDRLAGGAAPSVLAPLGEALGLAVGRLGIPR